MKKLTDLQKRRLIFQYFKQYKSIWIKGNNLSSSLRDNYSVSLQKTYSSKPALYYNYEWFMINQLLPEMVKRHNIDEKKAENYLLYLVKDLESALFELTKEFNPKVLENVKR